MMTPLHLSSAYRSDCDSMEKPGAVKPSNIPPLDIDALPSKAHDSTPPSVNDQVRLDVMVDMGSLGFPQMKSPVPIAINIKSYSS